MEGIANNLENKSNLSLEKYKKFGFFSMTAEDHKNINSTPPNELLENPNKAQYETMTDEEILDYLENAFNCIKDSKFIENGYAKTQKEFLQQSIPFLKSVNRLPEKYKNVNISSLDSQG